MWKLKILKKKMFGDMVDRGLPTKFGLDPCRGFQETYKFTNVGRTTDAMQRHDIANCQPELHV